jgi:hypothetical protein
MLSASGNGAAVTRRVVTFAFGRRKLTEGSSVADAFMQVADYLKMYAQYCSNFDRQNAKLAELRKAVPRLDQFLTEASRLPQCGKQDLSSFLIKPVQSCARSSLLAFILTFSFSGLCKYPLLLRVSRTSPLTESKSHRVCRK